MFRKPSPGKDAFHYSVSRVLLFLGGVKSLEYLQSLIRALEPISPKVRQAANNGTSHVRFFRVTFSTLRIVRSGSVVVLTASSIVVRNLAKARRCYLNRLRFAGLQE